MNAHVEPGHAVYSPSSAHRWTECTASAEAIAALGEREEGEAAKKGTAAHSELERVLGGAEADPDHESAYAVALAVAYLNGLPAGRRWVEQRVALTDQIWGRLDVGDYFEPDETVTILDLKDGFVDVSPVENDQERIYAAALIREHRLKVKWIRYVIVQPNSIVPGPRVKQWIESAESLAKWAANVAEIPKREKVFKAGPHCRYCPLFGRCEPTRDLLSQLSTMLQHTPEEIRPNQVAIVMGLKRPIEDWFKALDRAATKAALAGNVPEGMKLVTSVKHREWVDPAAARREVVNALGEAALELPTPAQAEKLGMAKAEVAALANVPEGGPALAFESDKRKPWAARTSTEMFKDVPRQKLTIRN
jgi:hypothetical protein